MTGMLPKKFQDRLQNIPTHLQYAISSRSLKYSELLSAVDLMSKEKCISFAKEEFTREYGKNGVAGLRSLAKKSNVLFLLRVVDDGRNIIIFKNDLPTKKVV